MSVPTPVARRSPPAAIFRSSGSNAMRRATVELDKVKGTEWPPEKVSHGGKDFTLKEIYEAAGMKLTLTKDQHDLPVPASGPNFDLVQLHQYMTQYRKPERQGWYAHILIVPNIEYAEAFQISRPIGVMYDFRSADLNNMPREGCAMSMRAVAADKRIYMRTLAHELGHVFNLLHPKSENPPLPIGTTLMNQTMDLQQLGNFPENIEYKFSDFNAKWLKRGPSDFVRPGGKPFADRPEDQLVLVADQAVEKTPGLELEISTGRAVVDLGEPLYLRVTLRNTSDKPIPVNSVLSVSGGTLDVWITGPTNVERRFRPVLVMCHESEVVALSPKAEILESIPIFFGAEGHTFPSPGTYKIRAVYQANVSQTPLAAIAKTHQVEVREPVSAADVSIADTLASPTLALFLILRGGDHLRGAQDEFEKMVADEPDRAVSQHAKLALANQALAPQTRNVKKALSMLGSVRDDQLDRVHRAERQRLLGLARACENDDQGVNAAVDEFSKIASQSVPDADKGVKQTRTWIDRVKKGQ
jgi:hypothetical protein